MKLDDYVARFAEEPGYLDHARVSPIGRTVVEEEDALRSTLQHARFGSLAPLLDQHERVCSAVAALTGIPAVQVVFQPNTSHGMMHAMFGITGGVALSPSEFPSMRFALERAGQALGVLTPHWLETDHGRVTPGNLRDQLTSAVTAVAVSLVDYRTGYLADLEGIRQVIGDRLLVVDAIQGFGVVDAPYRLADVIVAGGQKWVRAGWGAGFLALSDRALEHLTPVWSGPAGAEDPDLSVVSPPSRAAAAFQVTAGDDEQRGRTRIDPAGVVDIGLGGRGQPGVRARERVGHEVARPGGRDELPHLEPRDRRPDLDDDTAALVSRDEGEGHPRGEPAREHPAVGAGADPGVGRADDDVVGGERSTRLVADHDLGGRHAHHGR